MGKTRDLFNNNKKRDTKGTFHAKMGTINDRNGMDLTIAESIKKRSQEYAELYKRDLNDLDNHNGVIIPLEPDIPECKVKPERTPRKLELPREYFMQRWAQ